MLSSDKEEAITLEEGVISNLSESELRQLVALLVDSHPQAVASALALLQPGETAAPELVVKEDAAVEGGGEEKPAQDESSNDNNQEEVEEPTTLEEASNAGNEVSTRTTATASPATTTTGSIAEPKEQTTTTNTADDTGVSAIIASNPPSSSSTTTGGKQKKRPPGRKRQSATANPSDDADSAVEITNVTPAPTFDDTIIVEESSPTSEEEEEEDEQGIDRPISTAVTNVLQHVAPNDDNDNDNDIDNNNVEEETTQESEPPFGQDQQIALMEDPVQATDDETESKAANSVQATAEETGATDQPPSAKNENSFISVAVDVDESAMPTLIASNEPEQAPATFRREPDGDTTNLISTSYSAATHDDDDTVDPPPTMDPPPTSYPPVIDAPSLSPAMDDVDEKEEEDASSTSSDPPPLIDSPHANVHTPSTTNPKRKSKKRPPGKKRADDDDDNAASSIVMAQGVSSAPAESATASGASPHQVIPWTNERRQSSMDRGDNDNNDGSDAEDYFFDGYAVTSPHDKLVSTDAYPDAGCYLVFDSQGGGKLVLHYSKTRIPQAIGRFQAAPDCPIAGFKFTRNHGRVELIGNCASGKAGRKNYFSGVCQFIRAAKDVNGTLWIYPPHGNATPPQPHQTLSPMSPQAGLDVDIYVYVRSTKSSLWSVRLPEHRPISVALVQAVCCLPKHAVFMVNVKVDLNKWLDDANAVGTSIQFNDGGSKPLPSSSDGTEGQIPDNLFIPGVTAEPSADESVMIDTRSTGTTLCGTGEAGESYTVGCYLVYDVDGGKLVQHFSKTAVEGAIGFFSPGPTVKIPGFKFTSNQGRAELIGNCSSGGVTGRKNYYSGWCQFIRAAKAMQGSVTVFPGGIDVDLYTYSKRPEEGKHQTVKLVEHTRYSVSRVDAVCCLPKHAEFFDGLTMDLTRWIEEGSKVGSTIQV